MRCAYDLVIVPAMSKHRGIEHVRDQNVALVNRVIMLRGTLEGVTTDNAEGRRQLVRLRTENRALRAELANVRIGHRDTPIRSRDRLTIGA